MKLSPPTAPPQFPMPLWQLATWWGEVKSTALVCGRCHDWACGVQLPLSSSARLWGHSDRHLHSSRHGVRVTSGLRMATP